MSKEPRPIRCAGISLMSDGWYAILNEWHIDGDHEEWLEIERRGPFRDRDLAADVADSQVEAGMLPAPTMEPHWEDHPDDPYIDEVLLFHLDAEAYERDNTVIQPDPAASMFGLSSVKITLHERYKTSGLSGDEWRFSSHIKMMGPNGAVAIEDGCGTMQAAVAKVPHAYDAIIHERPRDASEEKIGPCVIMQFFRRGRLLFAVQFHSMMRAVASLPWHWLTWGENHEIPSERFQPQQEGLCCQPACQEDGVVVYRIIRKYERRTGRRVQTSGMWHHHRRFCAKHALRGDCGLEDADNNYALIEGTIQPGGGRVDPCVITKSRRITVPVADPAEIGERIADDAARIHGAVATGEACACPVCDELMVPGIDHICPRGEQE